MSFWFYKTDKEGRQHVYSVSFPSDLVVALLVVVGAILFISLAPALNWELLVSVVGWELLVAIGVCLFTLLVILLRLARRWIIDKFLN